MKEKEKVVKKQGKSRTPISLKEGRPAQPAERTEEELIDLTSRVYRLVVERGMEGVLQSEIWKELGLTSRDGSRLAIRLERWGLVGRVKSLEEGRWTYKLSPLRFPTDMASIENAPCMASQREPRCSMGEEVDALTCTWIGPWVINEYRAARTLGAEAEAMATQ